MRAKNTAKTVKYLKKNNGSWAYRRRVPERHHKTLGFKVWNRPCGDVSYQEAVFMVTSWTVEDNARIADLDDPTLAEKIRQQTEINTMAPKVTGLIKAQEFGILPKSFNPLEAAIAAFALSVKSDQMTDLGDTKLVEEALFIDGVVQEAVRAHSINPASIEAEIRKSLLPRLFGLLGGLDAATVVVDQVIDIVRAGNTKRQS